MALAKTYLTVNGKIRSEQRAGEAHSRDYVLDPLGSVIQIYQNGWPIADACYEPYGGIYTQWNMEGKTFTWLGGWGYRQTGVEWSSVYVRARHYSRGLSNWTSIDPLWPSEMAYGYVEGRVMTGVDYWGEMCIHSVTSIFVANDDPCKIKRGSLKDGCIASLCTLLSLGDLALFVKQVRTIKSFKNLIDDLVGGLREEPGSDPIPVDPISAAKECCRIAKQELGKGQTEQLLGITNQLSALIGSYCKENSKNPHTALSCGSITKYQEDCTSCCDALADRGLITQTVRDKTCKAPCYKKQFRPDGRGVRKGMVR